MEPDERHKERLKNRILLCKSQMELESSHLRQASKNLSWWRDQLKQAEEDFHGQLMLSGD